MTDRMAPLHRLRRAAALGAGLFGAITIVAAGGVLSGAGRGLAGDVVPFVLWANLALGFAYLAGAVLLWRQSPRARAVAVSIAAITLLTGLAFAAVAWSGVPVEPRTAGALAFRFSFWLAIAAIAGRTTR